MCERELWMKIRIDGAWKEYDVQINQDGTVQCELLQRDWSVQIMRWIFEIRVEHHIEFDRDVLFGYYHFDDMLASDMLFFE